MVHRTSAVEANAVADCWQCAADLFAWCVRKVYCKNSKINHAGTGIIYVKHQRINDTITTYTPDNAISRTEATIMKEVWSYNEDEFTFLDVVRRQRFESAINVLLLLFMSCRFVELIITLREQCPDDAIFDKDWPAEVKPCQLLTQVRAFISLCSTMICT